MAVQSKLSEAGVENSEYSNQYSASWEKRLKVGCCREGLNSQGLGDFSPKAPVPSKEDKKQMCISHAPLPAALTPHGVPRIFQGQVKESQGRVKCHWSINNISDNQISVCRASELGSLMKQPASH